jgi:hypothetical protein
LTGRMETVNFGKCKHLKMIVRKSTFIKKIKKLHLVIDNEFSRGIFLSTHSYISKQLFINVDKKLGFK